MIIACRARVSHEETRPAEQDTRTLSWRRLYADDILRATCRPMTPNIPRPGDISYLIAVCACARVKSHQRGVKTIYIPPAGLVPLVGAVGAIRDRPLIHGLLCSPTLPYGPLPCPALPPPSPSPSPPIRGRISLRPFDSRPLRSRCNCSRHGTICTFVLHSSAADK